MITHAYISHYKSVQEASLNFRDINVIVGPNGSGKSNLIDAIYFIHDCCADDIDTAVTKRHGIDSLRQWSKFRPYNITIEMKLNNRNGGGSYKLVLSSAKGNYRIIEESGHWIGIDIRRRASSDDNSIYSTYFKRDEYGNITITSSVPDSATDDTMGIDPDQLFLTNLASRFGLSGFLQLRNIADELSSFSKYNIYPNTLREPQLVSREITLEESGANLSSILKRVNGNKRFSANKEDMISALQIMMPSVVDFQVKSAAGYYVPVLRVEEHNGEAHDFNLSQISDGTLRTLGLLAAFYQPNAPAKIAVEEPEQMIHPGALPIIFEAIDAFVHERSGLNRQVFVTTHSPTFIDLFEPEDLIWARFSKGITEAGHVKARQLNIIKEQLFTAGELLLAEGLYE